MDFARYDKMKKISYEDEKKIYDYLNGKDMWCETWVDRTGAFDIIKVDINWGDWKHEHLRCDYLMEQIGYISINSFVTEENGSDCYSAQHWYVRRLA